MHEAESIGSTTAGPNWSAVPFEVGCARCGHDLRGLVEPKCPSCELEFDWAVAVPIEKLTCFHCGYHLYGLAETRCPECGESFTWQEVLDEYHRKQIPLFEYRWRKKPFKSMVNTWRLALHPTKFWSQITMHDPPHIGPLIVMIVLFILVMHILVATSLAVSSQVDSWRMQRAFSNSPNFRWFQKYQKTFLENALDLLQEVYRNLLQSELVIVLATWIVSSYLVLLIFQQSMRRCHVRNVHLVRVWVYSIPAIPLMTLATILGLLFVILRPYTLWTGSFECVFFIATIILIVLIVRSIQVAYKDYLLMPHGWAVAASVQVIAGFATLTTWIIVHWGW